MRCCCGYVFGARCRLFAYSPDDASAIPKPHHLLPQSRPVLPFLYWNRLTQVVLAIKRVCCSSISCRHTAVEMSQSVCCTAVVGTCLSVYLFSCTGFLIHARWTLTVLSSASRPPTSCFTWAPRKSPRMSQLFVSYSCCCICPLSSIIKSRRLTFFGHLA